MMGRLIAVSLFALLGACATGEVDDPTGWKDEAPPADSAKIPRAGTGGPIYPGADEPAPATVETSDKAGPLFRAAYDGTPSTSLNTFSRDEAALQADGTMTIATKKGRPGEDPEPAGYYGGSFYNGGRFRYASVLSPVWHAKSAFDRVTPSFEAITPAGTWIEVHVSAHVIATGEWTKEYSLGVWAHEAGTVRRHSVADQRDMNGEVRVDTLDLTSKADALQVSITLFSADATTTPVLRAVSAMTTLRGAWPKAINDGPYVWGKTLAVPHRTQNDASSLPTSTSMLLGWWGVDSAPAEVASLTTDIVASETENRLFASAFAAAAAPTALHSMVTRLWSLGQIERLVDAGVPAAIDVAYEAGQLDGAPLSQAGRHTVVVKGFSSTGNVVVNDPATSSDPSVDTTYDRAQLTAAWLRADGMTYLVWPSATKLPVDPQGAY